MTDTKLLREKIEDSGYKLTFIAKQLDITYAGLLKKINNETEFKVSEVAVLRELLKLGTEDVQKIFFGLNVDCKGTK